MTGDEDRATWNHPPAARPCVELLRAYRAAAEPVASHKLRLVPEHTNQDVYNISRPFVDAGEMVIAGRVERRDEEISEVLFFSRRSDRWVPRPGTRRFPLQDPFAVRLEGQLVFGGVEVETARGDSRVITNWRTAFYRGSCIADLERFATGPWGMKDIRLVALPRRRIGVMTRPMDASRNHAAIGFTTIGRLDDLTIQTVLGAARLQGQFVDGEWGGVGEVRVLASGVVAALGHLAWRSSEGQLHYYAATFAANPLTHATTAWRIIAERRDVPSGPAKRPDLADVMFPGGIRRAAGGRAKLYVGVSDAEAYWLDIPDPYARYETLALTPG